MNCKNTNILGLSRYTFTLSPCGKAVRVVNKKTKKVVIGHQLKGTRRYILQPDYLPPNNSKSFMSGHLILALRNGIHISSVKGKNLRTRGDGSPYSSNDNTTRRDAITVDKLDEMETLIQIIREMRNGNFKRFYEETERLKRCSLITASRSYKGRRYIEPYFEEAMEALARRLTSTTLRNLKPLLAMMVDQIGTTIKIHKTYGIRLRDDRIHPKLHK